MALEAAIDPNERRSYPFGGDLSGDWAPLLSAVRDDLDRRRPIGRIAARFHLALVKWICRVADRLQIVPVVLSVQNDTLAVARDPHPSRARVTARTVVRDGRQTAQVDPPLAFFIPEHVSDPSIRPAGEELWVEVTLPKQGPPRPIRLGVKKDGVLTPLAVE